MFIQSLRPGLSAPLKELKTVRQTRSGISEHLKLPLNLKVGKPQRAL